MDTLLSCTIIIMALSCGFSAAFSDDNDVRKLKIRVRRNEPNEVFVRGSLLSVGTSMEVLPSGRHEGNFSTSNQEVILELQNPNIKIYQGYSEVLDSSNSNKTGARETYDIGDAHEFNDRLVAADVNFVSSDNDSEDSKKFVHNIEHLRNMPLMGNDNSLSSYQLTDNRGLHNSDARNDYLSHSADRYNSLNYEDHLKKSEFNSSIHRLNDEISDSNNESSEFSMFVENKNPADDVSPPETGVLFSSLASSLMSLIITPLKSIKPLLIPFLNSIISESSQDCCETCVDGDSRCSVATGQCYAAGKGAYAAYCQKRCARSMIPGQSALPNFIPIEACRGLCAAGVQKLCKQHSCVNFGCYAAECESVAPTECG